MKKRLGFAVVAFAALVGGCAPGYVQQPVELTADKLPAKAGKIGVAMSTIPAVDRYLPGADCLLCIGVASAANGSLTDHIRSLSVEDLPGLKQQIADMVKKKGGDVVVVATPVDAKKLEKSLDDGPNKSPKDFSEFKTKYGIDKLLYLEISEIGTIRRYSAYVPLSDPKGYFHGTGYLVDLRSNMMEWYAPINIERSAEGNWDEPPKFPGMTNAFYQALEAGKDEFIKPFK
jgi:hypothetical protein